jgi:TPR repeat protein
MLGVLAAMLCLLVAMSPAHALSREDVPFVSRSAEYGNDRSQVLLAIAYLNGDGGLGRDPAQAAHWFELAALQGNPLAQERIAGLYERGLGVPANSRLAFDWRLKAAQRGDRDAQVKLAQMYLDGAGTARDDARARDWLERAAIEGSAQARQMLDSLERASAKPEGQLARSRTWLERAANRAYRRAADLLGFIENLAFSLEDGWHQRPPELGGLARDGDIEAQYQLAQGYEHGNHGVGRNLPEALRWYRTAADNGHRDARLAVERISKPAISPPAAGARH